MKALSVVSVVFGTLLTAAANASEVKEACTQLQAASTEGRLEYLRGTRSALEDRCVVYAIDQLGVERYGPSVKVLVKYLDYRLPDEPRSTDAFVQHAIPWLGTRYPAAKALAAMGKIVIPELIEAIGNADTPSLLRKNAIELLFILHRDDVAEGAAVLNRAGRTAGSPEVRQRLLDAARELAGRCPEPERGTCLSNALR